MDFREQIVKESPDSSNVGNSRLRDRVVETGRRRERSLDIRQYVESKEFTGWTRRGVRLTGEMLELLLEQAPAIAELLDQAIPSSASRGDGMRRRSPRKEAQP